MANSRTEQKALTRARILRAANILFREHGFEEAKTTEIASMVGISHGTIFAHFDSKASILRELVLKRMRADVEALGRVELEGDSAIEQVKDLVRRLWYRARSEAELTSVYHSQSWNWKLQEEEAFQEIVRKTLERAREIIEQGIEAGEIPADINIEMTLDLLQAGYFDSIRKAGCELRDMHSQECETDEHLIRFEETVDYLLADKNDWLKTGTK